MPFSDFGRKVDKKNTGGVLKRPTFWWRTDDEASEIETKTLEMFQGATAAAPPAGTAVNHLISVPFGPRERVDVEITTLAAHVCYSGQVRTGEDGWGRARTGEDG